MPDLGMDELDKLFCLNAKKYRLIKGKLLLKAISYVESSYNQRAYRYEPAFWTNYLSKDPAWKDQNPALVSASYGLMQLMWTTAWALGFRGTQMEDLEDPAVNIDLGAKLIRQILDKVYSSQACECFRVTPIGVALARYNGGSFDNPNKDGDLRNYKYVSKVFVAWDNLKLKEADCDTP